MTAASPPSSTDAGPPARPRLTIGVLTFNEEPRIVACLQSAAFADELIVVDSGSSDRTVEIARAHGAMVYEYADWQGFAVQRNRLLQHISGDYIFFVDADEEVSSALRAEVEAVVRSGQPGRWTVRWRVISFGRELRYFRGQAPVQRLFRRDMLVEFTGAVHEVPVFTRANVPRFHLSGPLLHRSRETVHDSLKKLTQYVMLGAAKRYTAGKYSSILTGGVTSVLLFIRLYLFKGAFLGGGPGFLHCFFIALECFLRHVAARYDQGALNERVKR